MRHANKMPLLLAAVAAVAGIRLAIWILPFGTLRRMTGALSRPMRHSDSADSKEICRSIMIVSRFVPKATCLTQALAAQVLLGRRGYENHLRIGVGKPTDSFRAHAWIENQQGEILIGHTDRSQFVLLPSIDNVAAA
jgi:hypothetical protein